MGHPPSAHRWQGRRSRLVGTLAGAIATVIWLAGCGAAGPSLPLQSPPASLGPVTPAPSPGAFGCPVQVLAGATPTSRLVDVQLTRQGAFDRVTFVFAPGGPPSPATDSALIVRPVGHPPGTDANGNPLTMAGERFIEVRFRDMALVGPEGGPSFIGSRDLTAQGAVREVIEIEESRLALDWLIGTTAPGCARVWVDMAGMRLYVDVQG